MQQRITNRLLSLFGFQQWLRILRWLLPFSLILVVVVYEVGPSRWIFDAYGFTTHLTAEIVIFGTIGPVLAYVLLELLTRWLDERSTSDWQSKLLRQTRQELEESRQLNDQAVQLLFANGALLSALKSDLAETSTGTVAHIEIAEQALQTAARQLRASLEE